MSWHDVEMVLCRVCFIAPAFKVMTSTFVPQKRLRVRLSSRFSAADEAGPAGRTGRQYRSDPEEDASHPPETDAVDLTVRTNRGLVPEVKDACVV